MGQKLTTRTSDHGLKTSTKPRVSILLDHGIKKSDSRIPILLDHGIKNSDSRIPILLDHGFKTSDGRITSTKPRVSILLDHGFKTSDPRVSILLDHGYKYDQSRTKMIQWDSEEKYDSEGTPPPLIDVRNMT